MVSWSAIVGAARTDKYEIARSIAGRLRARGLVVGGFAQPLIKDAEDAVLGWDVEHLGSGERVVLARTSTVAHVCNYGFEQAAFEAAARWIREPADVVIAEGVGKLEAAGAGHWPALSGLLADERAPHLVLGIRDTCLATIVLQLPDPGAHIQLPASDAELEAFAEEVAALVSAGRAQGPKAAFRTA